MSWIAIGPLAIAAAYFLFLEVMFHVTEGGWYDQD
jgi:hypothetical protein